MDQITGRTVQSALAGDGAAALGLADPGFEDRGAGSFGGNRLHRPKVIRRSAL
jgi:hypothetical protein